MMETPRISLSSQRLLTYSSTATISSWVNCSPNAGMPLFELWQVRVFPELSALAHYTVEQPISVVPSVAISVQGRGGEDAIRLADMPVGLALAFGAVARGASSCEDFLPGGWGWGGGWSINARGRRAGGHQGQGNDQECNRKSESANCNSVVHHLFNGKRQQEMEQNKCMKDEFRGKSTLLPSEVEYQDNARASQNQLKDVPESEVDSSDLPFCDPELSVGIRE